MKKIIFFLAILAVGYYVFQEKFAKEPSVEYITQKATKGALGKRVEAAGEIFATELIDVGAQVSGQIKKLYVKLGDSVKKGDMIAEIDSSTQQNNVDNSRAQLEIYQAQLDKAQVALDVAKTQFEREDKLYKNSATSKQEYENAKNSYASTQANIKELKAKINQAKISLNTAQIDLGYTKITAPRDGVVVAVRVEEGQTVNANQTTPTIVNIADLSYVKMKMEIAEGDITKVKVGTPVEYTILSEPDKKFHTKVSFIDPGLTTLSDGKYSLTTSSSGSTGTASAVYYYAQSIVENKDGILRIGMTTQNKLLVSSATDAIIIPSVAVKKEGEKSVVSILKSDKTIEKREVKTGIKDNLKIQILEGVLEGEEVVVSQISSDEIDKMVKKEQRGMR